MQYSQDTPLKAGESALLVIDMQNNGTIPGVGKHKHFTPDTIPEKHQYFFDRINNTVIPNIKTLLSTYRGTKSEVIFIHIESLTEDGRDRSLGHKILNYHVGKGSYEAQVIEELAPGPDEMNIGKTACCTFCSTNLEYILRNLGVQQLVMVGMYTNECVESAVRHAAEKGFLVTLVEDACAAATEAGHKRSLENLKFCSRICTTTQVQAEVNSFIR